MEIDKTSYSDLSVFHQEEEYSIFHKLNLAQTAEGKKWLYKFFQAPFSDAKLINETQTIIRLILSKMDLWPTSITNGTVMVISKFFDTEINTLPGRENVMNAYSYKIFNAPDFALVKYSLSHFADFVRGMKLMVALLNNDETPPTLTRFLLRARDLMDKPSIEELASRAKGQDFSLTDTIHYGKFIKYEFKTSTLELINIFGRLDAWYSMAAAHKKYNLSFPVIYDNRQPSINAKGLYHVLIPKAVPYDVEMNIESNFIFLTGANMAGKSTFIKAVGSAVFLAHLGMGVPAKQFNISVFDGVLSNINVVDNIFKGESYFFNEVQRIKDTILKINDGRKWLVLIDELFKGTNVQDAMKCSSTVIKGLIKISNSLFILSTHLYEIGEELKTNKNISFKYFETDVREDQLEFSYQLKDGVSNDRIGYIILKREKVVEMLENL